MTCGSGVKAVVAKVLHSRSNLSKTLLVAVRGVLHLGLLNESSLINKDGGVKNTPPSVQSLTYAKLSLTRRSLHNPPKTAAIVALRERHLRRELKDLDFLSAPIDRERSFAEFTLSLPKGQGRQYCERNGLRKALLAKGDENWLPAVRGVLHLGLFAILLSVTLLASPAFSVTINVTANATDALNGADGQCSLREAITNINDGLDTHVNVLLS